MLERVDIEVATELAIDPDQQIAVEGSGDAERIVVGEQEIGLRLHEIGPEQKRVTRRERRADCCQESIRVRRIEIADVRTEKEREQAPAAAAFGGGVRQPRF